MLETKTGTLLVKQVTREVLVETPMHKEFTNALGKVLKDIVKANKRIIKKNLIIAYAGPKFNFCKTVTYLEGIPYWRFEVLDKKANLILSHANFMFLASYYVHLETPTAILNNK